MSPAGRGGSTATAPPEPERRPLPAYLSTPAGSAAGSPVTISDADKTAYADRDQFSPTGRPRRRRGDNCIFAAAGAAGTDVQSP
jgi:hypothetical protein